jgi:hypothetical protein
VGANGERSTYLWARNVSGSSDWQQLSKLTDAEVGSQFGVAVALSGSTMEFVIGGQLHTPALPLDSATSVACGPLAVCHVVMWRRVQGENHSHVNLSFLVH